MEGMAELSQNDVLKLAELAKLELSSAEVEEFAQEFNQILAYVEQLQKVDTTGLKPTAQVTGLTNVMRPDSPHGYGYKPSDLLKNVPAVKDGQIKVKRTLG